MSNTVKYKLDDFAEADESVLIGIISSAPDYTVCWHINKQLELNLCRCTDVKIELVQRLKKSTSPDLFSTQTKDDDESISHSLHHAYKFIDEQFFSDYYLIANKGSSINLEPQLKRVTYFFEVTGMKAENADQLVFDLNTIETIEMAYLIGKESIINKLQLHI